MGHTSSPSVFRLLLLLSSLCPLPTEDTPVAHLFSPHKSSPFLWGGKAETYNSVGVAQLAFLNEKLGIGVVMQGCYLPFTSPLVSLHSYWRL